jgi:hypothetical protein
MHAIHVWHASVVIAKNPIRFFFGSIILLDGAKIPLQNTSARLLTLLDSGHVR